MAFVLYTEFVFWSSDFAFLNPEVDDILAT
jgi:hypothetical protein